MARTWMVVSLSLLFLVSACGKGDPPPDWGLPEPIEGDASDLTGVWAQHQFAISETQQIFGRVDTTSLSLVRLVIEQTGSALTLDAQICEISVTSEPAGGIEISFSDAFIDALPIVAGSGSLIGSALEQTPAYSVVGAVVEDLVYEALPEEPDDPRVVDGDEDGNPGVTVTVSGNVDGEVYVVQRGMTGFTAEVTEGNRIEGSLTWATDQVALAAQPKWLKGFANKEATPLSKSHFRMVKIDPTLECEQLTDY